MQFQTITIVRLRTGDVPAPDSPKDDEIQAAHIAYLNGLIEQGVILANGPVRRKDDDRFRGMSLYAVGPDEARAFANEDPAVQAGWFEPHVDVWLLPSRPVTLGNRVDVEM